MQVLHLQCLQITLYSKNVITSTSSLSWSTLNLVYSPFFLYNINGKKSAAFALKVQEQKKPRKSGNG